MFDEKRRGHRSNDRSRHGRHQAIREGPPFDGLDLEAEHGQRVDAARSLTLGPEAASALRHPASFFVIRALAWAAAFVLIFAPLTVARFKRA